MNPSEKAALCDGSKEGKVGMEAGACAEASNASFLTDCEQQLRRAVQELIDEAHLQEGQILVIGCSTSEVVGERIGTHSGPEIGRALFAAAREVTKAHGIEIAAQCCEHLNRALVVEACLAQRERWQLVNAIPQPKAGGSFATAAYEGMEQPVLVDRIEADAGLDIGLTLIGMHLKRVAVPVRLKANRIGSAILVAARSRLPYIGGQRAVYDSNLQ